MKDSDLQMVYTSEGKTKSEIYKVQPYQLIFDNGIWELWAYCLRQKHEGMRNEAVQSFKNFACVNS